MKLRPEVKDAMKYLHIDKLRKNQIKPINSILDGKDTMVNAATGYGKSFIYLIPAVISRHLTVIIEPLIVLMHDQVQKLRTLGIEAYYIDHTLTRDELMLVFDKIHRREIKLLYVSPEQIETGLLFSVEKYMKIGLLAIDECHCVISWGSTFRESYLHIGEAIGQLKKRPVILAVSATVPLKDQPMIERQLSMRHTEHFQFTLYRSNLIFMKKKTDCVKDKLRETKNALKKYRKDTAIIFCATKTITEQIAKELEKKYRGEVVVYHSGNKKQEAKLMNGGRHIIVATGALSMGVDIPNVDLIVNFNMPMSLMDFSQMAGRAGREGQKAHCLLLWDDTDYFRNLHLLDTIRDEKAYSQATDRLDEMREYCDDKKQCMVTSLLEALGDKHSERCRFCTVCQEQRRGKK